VRLLTALLLLVVPAPLLGADPDAVLARLQRQSAGVERLQADFVQEKHLAMFKKPLVSKGRFHFRRPDALRWEVTEPVRTGFVLQGGKGRRWHERTGKSESFTVDRDPVMRVVAGQILAWAGTDFDRLRREYTIAVVSENPAVLRLVPPAQERFVDHLRVSFAPDGRHVQEVELHEKGGDFTRIRFSGAAVNPSLPEGLFK
jgi:outer membrane lipoprotein-sorting protein